MPLKSIIFSSQEIEEAVKGFIQEEGLAPSGVCIDVNEELGEDVAVFEVNGEKFERKIMSFSEKLNSKFEIEIKSYEGFHCTEFPTNASGYAFIIS